MSVKASPYHIYVDTEGFSEDFIEFMESRGATYVELTPEGPFGGGQGGSYLQENWSKVLNAMIDKAQAEKALRATTDPAAAAKLQTLIDKLQQVINGPKDPNIILELMAAARVLVETGIPVITAFAGACLAIAVGMALVTFMGRLWIIGSTCGTNSMRSAFRLVRLARQGGIDIATAAEIYGEVEYLVGCAHGNPGGGPTQSGAAALDQQENGSTEGWDAAFTARGDFPEEGGGNPCGQCGHDPCICP
jgi:hypothetical protein